MFHPFYRHILFVLLLILAACDSHHPSFPFYSKTDQEVIDFAQSLPREGILQQGSDGFVYLKIPNDYVYRLFPLVKEPGFFIPDSVRRHTKIGAHISVFHANEARAIGPIDELGQKFSFEPKQIRVVKTHRKDFIILEVKAPELEKLRQSYGLSPKLHHHEFHITLADKRVHKF